MVIAGVGLGGGVALTLTGLDVNDHALVKLLGLPKKCLYSGIVVSVHRAEVVKPHVLEIITAVERVLDGLLGVTHRAEKPIANQGQALERTGYALFSRKISGSGAQTSHVRGEAADVLRDRHLILVNNDDEPQTGGHVVKGLVDHAAGKGSVSHHRHGVCVPPCHTVSLGKAKRRRQRGGAMPCAKAVIFTLRALGKARQATASAERAKGFIAPSQQFMDVALMADVKNNMIARAVKHAVYGN